MAQHALSRCDQCGQVDDHPKAHFNTGETFHHDCLPYDKRAEVLEAGGELAQAVLEACEGGKKGDELRAHIFSLHKGDDE